MESELMGTAFFRQCSLSAGITAASTSIRFSVTLVFQLGGPILTERSESEVVCRRAGFSPAKATNSVITPHVPLANLPERSNAERSRAVDRRRRRRLAPASRISVDDEGGNPER